jgi:hypothetical protein
MNFRMVNTIMGKKSLNQCIVAIWLQKQIRAKKNTKEMDF